MNHPPLTGPAPLAPLCLLLVLLAAGVACFA